MCGVVRCGVVEREYEYKKEGGGERVNFSESVKVSESVNENE